MTTLSDYLDHLTAPAQIGGADGKNPACCAAWPAAIAASIRVGRRGVCGVRFNQDGELRVPWGYVATAQLDPIEKKPFSHVLPGSRILTFGMLGCDFHCGYCQNWITSQTLRDPEAGGKDYVQRVQPEQLVQYARAAAAPRSLLPIMSR